MGPTGGPSTASLVQPAFRKARVRLLAEGSVYLREETSATNYCLDEDKSFARVEFESLRF